MAPTLQADGWLNPHPIQQQFLHSFRPRNYFIAGRGAGKTAVACKKAEFLSVLSPGIVVMITEQTVRDIKDVLYPCWAEVVTPGTYTIHGSGGDTEIRFLNGSKVWFRSRQARRINDDPPFRGPTVGYIIHDELALDRREDVLAISEAMLRQKRVKWLGCDIITTPKPNWLYRQLLGMGIAEPIADDESNRKQVSEDGQAVAFYAKTDDNAHNRGLHGRMVDNLSESMARQELLGEWVARDGKVWEFSEEQWPAGNMVSLPFNRQRPWILSVDLGGSDGCWQIWQKEDLMLGQGRIDCVVLKAEWTPQQIDPMIAFNEVLQYTKDCTFRDPSAIKIGADYRTVGPVGGSAEYMFSKIECSNGHGNWTKYVENITGWKASKDVQDIQASYIIRNARGLRRFCISTKLESFYKGASRGLMDVMRHDTYPDPGSKDYFRKEKSQGIYHEDSRDAFLYMAVSVYPPEFRPHIQEDWQAA